MKVILVFYLLLASLTSTYAQYSVSHSLYNNVYHFHKAEYEGEDLIITYNNEANYNEQIKITKVIINGGPDVILSGDYFISEMDPNGEKYYRVEYEGHTDTSTTVIIHVANSIEEMLANEDSSFSHTNYGANFTGELSAVASIEAYEGLKYLPTDYFVLKGLTYSDNPEFELPPTENPGPLPVGGWARKVVLSCTMADANCTREAMQAAMNAACGVQPGEPDAGKIYPSPTVPGSWHGNADC